MTGAVSSARVDADLVQQLERVAGLSVILLMKVTIGMSRRRQISNSLRVRALDAHGGVDHHHRRVHSGQRAVGVFGEVLMAGGVEQVEDAASVLEGHDRGDDGDAALALDAHPVGTGATALALGADVAGELDGAAGAQQVFRQRGLAGVGVGDDREGAAAGDLGGGVAWEVVGGHGSSRKGSAEEGTPAPWSTHIGRLWGKPGREYLQTAYGPA